MSAVTFVLVRHGESEWNLTGRWQGHAGTGLTALGRRQAEAAARWVAARHPGARVLARSDLQRVEETAAPLESRLGVPVVVDPRLRELDVGWWAGLTHQEIIRRDPSGLEAWLRGDDVTCGGGERRADLRARVAVALQELEHRLLAAQGGGTAVVVAHGGTIRAAASTLLATGVADPGTGGDIANGSVTELRRAAGGWVLRSWAATGHLPAAPREREHAAATAPR